MTFLDAGSSFSFNYQANVLTTPTGGTTLDNTATVTGTSLAGDNGDTPFFGTTSTTLGTPGTGTGERTGAGGINDYAASDTESLGSIGDRVWVDVDGDGTQDAGEQAITGVTIRMRGSDVNGNAVDLTTTTDATGFYRFADLLTGAYTVTEVQPRRFLDGRDTPGTPGLPGMTPANDSFRNFVLPTGTDAVNYNFGELTGTTSLRGFVYVDRNRDGVKQANEPGIAGVVRLIAVKGRADTPHGLPILTPRRPRLRPARSATAPRVPTIRITRTRRPHRSARFDPWKGLP